ncbi:MAG: hypothetical protein WA021_00980 [Minisyncoccia bacterium]
MDQIKRGDAESFRQTIARAPSLKGAVFGGLASLLLMGDPAAVTAQEKGTRPVPSSYAEILKAPPNERMTLGRALLDARQVGYEQIAKQFGREAAGVQEEIDGYADRIDVYTEELKEIAARMSNASGPGQDQARRDFEETDKYISSLVTRRRVLEGQFKTLTGRAR